MTAPPETARDWSDTAHDEDPAVVSPSREDPVVRGLAEVVGGPLGEHASRRPMDQWLTPARVVILLAIAYVAGYWPEHRHRVTLEGEVATLRARVADTEARVRMGRLLGDVLSIREAVTSLNFGVAQQQSSTLFDSVRAEASVTPVAVFKAALESMLQARDHVTAGLARGDQATVEPLLRRMELQLREVLGYSISSGQPTAGLSEPAR